MNETKTAERTAGAGALTDFERLLERDGKRAVEFTPYGSNDRIKLTPKLVQDLICIPTKSGRVCSERDAIRFMMLCLAKRLNPFDGDAFLQGYDGKDGPAFSLITAHQAYLKRAELHPEFDGFQSGVIVEERETEQELELEGDYYNRATRTLLGGWCRVHCKTRKVAIYKRLDLRTFTPSWGGTRWEKDGAGMIVKCAEADALRTLAPTMLGGLYLREEIEFDLSGNTSRPERTARQALVEVRSPGEEQGQEAAEARMGLAPEISAAVEGTKGTEGTDVASAKAAASAKLEPEKLTIQQELSAVVEAAGFDFSTLQKWGGETGSIPDAGSLGSYDEIRREVCERLLRALRGAKSRVMVLEQMGMCRCP